VAEKARVKLQKDVDASDSVLRLECRTKAPSLSDLGAESRPKAHAENRPITSVRYAQWLE